ncbi:AGE family epimerase/isomerase [Ferrovibrio sp.]|uniref:AGE family epimerase/isomerase n=1 Tax=Ferrovibrio sp. TaxID=1917215 RepID=UPI0025C066A8|nr:AGE family epimerase/isomerase [Ferrovibrio sp.]
MAGNASKYAAGHGNEGTVTKSSSVLPPFSEPQRSTAQRFVRHVFVDMAGLWLDHGWDAAGSHNIERLQAADLAPVLVGYRRSMAVARQLFFFSQAWRITGNEKYAARAHALYADLTGRFWDHQHHGWFFSLKTGADAQAPADPRKDAYGHAFAIFALAEYGAIFGKSAALDWSQRTLVAMKQHLLLPQGWYAQSASRDWRERDMALEQNPHMHLLEALLALHAATRDSAISQEGVLRDAGDIVLLFMQRLRADDGTRVLEHFDAAGRPDGENGRIVEPGHSYEWAGLLLDYAAASGETQYRQIAMPLLAWADMHGVDPQHGGIYDQLDTESRVVSDRKRIWPMTECVKLQAMRAIAMAEPAAYAALDRRIAFLAQHYLTPGGGWREFLRRDLSPDSDYLPATTPYHIATAALKVAEAYGIKVTS